MRAPILGILLLASALGLGMAGASGSLDTPLLVVDVEDHHGESCAYPVAGFCEFDVQGADRPSEAYVDVSERIYSVGVATNGTTLALLPEYAYAFDGSVPHPGFALASDAWQRAPPAPLLPDYAWMELSRDGWDVYVYGPPADRPLKPVGPRHVALAGFGNDTWLGYDGFDLTQFYVAGANTTDGHTDQARSIACRQAQVPSCDLAWNGTIDAFQSATPTVRFGANLQRVGAATREDALLRKADAGAPPEELAGPRSAAPEAPVVRHAWDVDPWSPTAPPGVGAQTDLPASPQPDPSASAPAASPTHGILLMERTLAPLLTGTLLAGSLLLLAWTLYSRFQRKDDLLHAGIRQRILDIVEADPGISVSEVLAHVDVTRNAVIHHARMLSRAGLLRIVRDQGRTRLVPCGAQRSLDPARLSARTQILKLLQAAGCLPREEIHQRLARVPLRTRNHALRQLLDQGIVEQAEVDGAPSLRLAGAA